jgi:hypothetical protein
MVRLRSYSETFDFSFMYFAAFFILGFDSPDISLIFPELAGSAREFIMRLL